MSKTVELARHLETLHINNMYKTDFYWTWDKTDEEIDAVFTVADALREKCFLPRACRGKKRIKIICTVHGANISNDF